MSDFRRAIILGSSGMLGKKTTSIFQSFGVPTIALSRQTGLALENPMDLERLFENLGVDSNDFVINCVGWIPQKSSGDARQDTNFAIGANTLFPVRLDQLAEKSGAFTMQILTDCVFKGAEGAPYSELDEPDNDDLYGLSKRLGESPLRFTFGVRASIIGITNSQGRSLVDWLLKSKSNSEINGYVNHLWNGVSTVAFARLALGLYQSSLRLTGKQHWFPKDSVSKYELLQMIRKASKRLDLRINEFESDQAIDRRLTTNDFESMNNLWRYAGYTEIPTIYMLVDELINEGSLS